MHTTHDPRFEALTPRQKQIAGMLANDRSTEEISDELEISPHTTRTHVKNAMKTLELRHRAGLAACAAKAEVLQ